MSDTDNDSHRIGTDDSLIFIGYIYPEPYEEDDNPAPEAKKIDPFVIKYLPIDPLASLLSESKEIYVKQFPRPIRKKKFRLFDVLIPDLREYLFSFLSILDIIALSEACVRLRKIVADPNGTFIKRLEKFMCEDFYRASMFHCLISSKGCDGIIHRDRFGEKNILGIRDLNGDGISRDNLIYNSGVKELFPRTWDLLEPRHLNVIASVMHGIFRKEDYLFENGEYKIDPDNIGENKYRVATRAKIPSTYEGAALIGKVIRTRLPPPANNTDPTLAETEFGLDEAEIFLKHQGYLRFKKIESTDINWIGLYSIYCESLLNVYPNVGGKNSFPCSDKEGRSRREIGTIIDSTGWILPAEVYYSNEGPPMISVNHMDDTEERAFVSKFYKSFGSVSHAGLMVPKTKFTMDRNRAQLSRNVRETPFGWIEETLTAETILIPRGQLDKVKRLVQKSTLGLGVMTRISSSRSARDWVSKWIESGEMYDTESEFIAIVMKRISTFNVPHLDFRTSKEDYLRFDDTVKFIEDKGIKTLNVENIPTLAYGDKYSFFTTNYRANAGGEYEYSSRLKDLSKLSSDCIRLSDDDEGEEEGEDPHASSSEPELDQWIEDKFTEIKVKKRKANELGPRRHVAIKAARMSGASPAELSKLRKKLRSKK